MFELLTLTATVATTSLLWRPGLTVETALWGIERSGAALETFAANIVVENFSAFEDEREQRYGRLVLDGTDQTRRIACRFDSFRQADGTTKSVKDVWVYADGWLAEIDESSKSFKKRQVVEPGTAWDPLKLGEGPLPLPFGQPAAEVAARFDAALTSLPTSGLAKAALGNEVVCGLKLIPKEGTKLGERIASIELFIDERTLSPRMVNLTKKNNDRTTIVLGKPATNEVLSPADRELLVMPSPDPAEWTVEIVLWSETQAS